MYAPCRASDAEIVTKSATLPLVASKHSALHRKLCIQWRPDGSDMEADDLQFDSIQIDSCDMKSVDWMQTLCIDGEKVTFKLDTGAQANIVRLNDLKR